VTLRARLTLSAAAAVAVAVVLAAGVVYAVVRHELFSQVDKALQSRVDALQHLPPDQIGPTLRLSPALLGQPAVYVQLVDGSGRVFHVNDLEGDLRADKSSIAVAKGLHHSYYQTVTLNDRRIRVLTAPLVSNIAVQAARPVDETYQTLNRLALILSLIALIGVALAALAGALVARTALAPIRRLSETTAQVTATGDLTRRVDIPDNPSDELGRLAADFNTMLATLERSVSAQRQLVADASHELRTPLTSLRTNIEVLASEVALEPEDKQRLLADVTGQIEEMSTLVADVVELAREGERESEPEPIRLDLLVTQALQRFERRSPQARFQTALAPVEVAGRADDLERAVNNLLDNAVKWSPKDALVAVSVKHDVDQAVVEVRDHGPGIAPADLPHIFNRFYRASAARGKPGSGLGLAIVRKVADEHGGQVTVTAAPGGGTIFAIKLPALPASDEPGGPGSSPDSDSERPD
jgi:two-component system sensor histidine kinase MprB